MENSPVFNIFGVCYDSGSTFKKGAAHAPPEIRKAFFSSSTNMWSEYGYDLGAPGVFRDTGDLHPDSFSKGAILIRERILETLQMKSIPGMLGGDHSISLPAINAMLEKNPDLIVLHFDAHPDLYDQIEGKRYSHASPFARLLEKRPKTELWQIGVRSITGHQKKQAKRFGIRSIPMEKIDSAYGLVFNRPVYLSIDIDVLDPAYAPGVSHIEPGGFSTRQLLTILKSLKAEIAGFDIVEYNPLKDPAQITAYAAAKLLKEIMGKVLCSRNKS